MQDDKAVPPDRENVEATAVPSHRPTREDHASASDRGEEHSADSPAALSALSHPADVEEVALSDEEIAIYRRRVAEGVYNTREVADEVARRMMRRGDI